MDNPCQLSPRPSRFALLTTFATVLAALTLCLADRTPVHCADTGTGQKFEIKQGDHISFIGNTLADRMQHDGWLETYLQARFPKHQLSFRNLGFSGDELNLRLRSANFGSPDQWLRQTGTDVVFAFFGYNESFAGAKGLDQFKKDLDAFVKHTLGEKYNDKTPPRLVLFSPIAHENLHDRNLPDGSENNKRLALYTKAMAEVARASKVPFVDLFHPTEKLYASAKKPLTINGIHLTAEGNRLLAEVIDNALFEGQNSTGRDPLKLDRLRKAVLEKDFYWFNRYRTTDGYSIFGGRAGLRFVGGQTNRVVMAREMEVLDVMTANRDKVVWAAAQGKEIKADDSNTPAFIPVQTNKPGPLPGGKHVFLDPTDAISRMKLGKGIKVNLFASEKDIKELVNPVQMSFDPQGRLWVAVWPTYPHWKPKEQMNDKLLILEDTDGDGKADKVTTFADRLHNPTGFEFYNGGVIVAQAPDLVFLKDTDGDGKADVRKRIIHGLDSADTHHTSNSFTLDPGGAMYFQEGTFHHTQVESPYGPPIRNANAGVYRYEPRAQKFGVYVTFGFANPHGHVFDRWGQDIVVDGTGAVPYHGALFSGHLEFPQKHARPPQVYQQRTRPCPGMEILSSRHFPDEFQGNLLVPNVIGFQGILRYKLEDKGASLGATEQEPLLFSSDPSFRPTDVKVGPDGAVYFIDWQNPIIGHMQHNLRDPSRDREHGRVYRITYEHRKLLQPVKIAGQPIDKLLDLLGEPEDRVRYRTRIELGGRDTDQVIAAAKKWIAKLDEKDPQFAHKLLEGLWLHQSHNVVDVDLLKRVLGLKDFRARAAATRVLCYWHDRVPGSLDLLKKLAADPHPRVRMEAVRAASFYKVPEAVEVVLIATEQPTDQYIDYVRRETLKALDPYVKQAIAQGVPIKFTTSAGARYFLKNVSTDDLLKMKRDRGVYLELLFRSGVRDQFRREALSGLAKLDKKSEMNVLLEAIRNQESGAAEQESSDQSVTYDLIRLLTDRPAALKDVRDELEKMATGAKTPVHRQLGFVALIAADGGVDRAWTLATKTTRGLQDLVRAMPLVRDPGERAALYPKIEPLLEGLPKNLAQGGKSKTVLGRYVRVELPGRQRTLTLAEVEVYSDGRNVALQGKATQSSTAHGGTANKGIDGNTSGKYGDGGQTHTREGTNNPWWEVDLGTECPIDRVVIFNRTDGNLNSRLKNYILKVLDKDRSVVFEKRRLPTPEVKAIHEVGGESPERIVRRAAMLALPSVRGKEADTFKTLAKYARSDKDRQTAVQALMRIPASRWPKEEAKPLLDSLLAYVRKVPVKDRTAPAVLEALQLSDSLAALLPLDQARAIRKDLGELGVRIIRIGTVPDQMLFDKERIVVRAGKPFEILFENTDLMPHNFVILQPGSLVEIGELGEATATQPGAMARNYVPPSKKIMLASRLLQPRQQQRLAFTAPNKPGVYPYVCTYPGHWRRMYGAMYVVEDLDEYLANPGSYLAKHKLPIADDLLKFVRPRTEWKFDELSPLVAKLDHGRSLANGRQMFQVATCIACHKVEGKGTELGPDLTKLDVKMTTVDILKDVLEPSSKINEKYQTWTFETTKGKVVTGLVVSDTAKEVKVIENPLAKTAPVVLKKSEIASRTKSPTSVMPKGLLDKLTREEILDLIAYVAARGDMKHKLFQGGHEH
jgi:putative heme-binding domain-containing protein